MEITVRVEIPALERLCETIRECHIRDMLAPAPKASGQWAVSSGQGEENGTHHPSPASPATEGLPARSTLTNTSSGPSGHLPLEGEGNGEPEQIPAKTEQEHAKAEQIPAENEQIPVKNEQGPAAQEEEPQPAGAGAPVTLDAVQRAAVQLRDEGMLGRVTAMFPEFGIKKISDLKGDALEAFAGRLRELGAKV